MTKALRDKAVRLLEENIRGIRYSMQPHMIKQSVAAHLFKASEVGEFKQFSLEKLEVYEAVVKHLKALADVVG